MTARSPSAPGYGARRLFRRLAAGAAVALMLSFPLDAACAASRRPPPRLALEAVRPAPDPLVSGEAGLLSVTFVNTSPSQPAHNILLRFQEPKGLLIPVEGASAFVDQLKPGERFTWQLPLTCSPEAGPGYLQAGLVLEYEAPSGLVRTQTEPIVVEVDRPVRLAYDPPQLPAQACEGDNLAFSMQLMNLGRDEIRNVILSFDMPGLDCGGPVLVGTILPGEAGTAAANLLVSLPDQGAGMVSGSLTLSYEDILGRKSQRQHDLTIQLLPRQAAAASASPEPGGDAGASKPPVFWLAALFVLSAACLAQHAYIRRLKRRSA